MISDDQLIGSNRLVGQRHLEQAGGMDTVHRPGIASAEDDGDTGSFRPESADDQIVAGLVGTKDIEGRAVVAADDGLSCALVQKCFAHVHYSNGCHQAGHSTFPMRCAPPSQGRFYP